MATHSSVLAWKIPGTEEPGGLPSMGSHRVGHDWCDLAAAAAGGDLCGDREVLYLDCGGGCTNLHKWWNDIELYTHIVPMSVSWFWYCMWDSKHWALHKKQSLEETGQKELGTSLYNLGSFLWIYDFKTKRFYKTSFLPPGSGVFYLVKVYLIKLSFSLGIQGPIQSTVYCFLQFAVYLNSHNLGVVVVVQSLSHVWLFATPWTIAHQAPLSIAFPRQEYWSGFSFPLAGDLPDQGMESMSPVSSALTGRFFITSTTGKPQLGCRRGVICRCSIAVINANLDKSSPSFIPDHDFKPSVWLLLT